MYELAAHPAAPSATVERITVTATRPRRRDRARAIASTAISTPSDGPIPPRLPLRTNCGCTAAARRSSRGRAHSHRELNLSPSTRYAIYDFNGYRGAMRDAAERDIRLSFDRATATLTAEVAMPALADVAEWRLGLTAVIEDASGAKSDWALHHPGDAPDFHDRAGFVARLAAPPQR
ncbi:hypothetical protein AB5I41_29330 [Sphingomonas sp. MMS24-JH45]